MTEIDDNVAPGTTRTAKAKPKKDLDPEQWVTMAEAAALAGVSQKVIGKFATEGAIRREHNGTIFLFNVDDLEIVSRAANRDHLTEQLKSAQTHAEQAFKLVIEPWGTLQKLYETEIARLTKRVEHLEKGHDDLIRAREEALNEAHERKLAERREDAKEARWASVFKTLNESSPMLLDQIGQTFVNWSRAGVGQAAARAFDELDPAIIAGILEGEKLSPAVREALQAILDERTGRPGPRAASDEPDTSNGVH